MQQKSDKIFVHVDKTVVKITGIAVKGLNVQELENKLFDKLKSAIRIIGVTGNSLEMDIYGMEEAAILKDQAGIIKAISFVEGITVSDLSTMSSVEKIKSVDFADIPDYLPGGCAKERWLE